MDKCIRVKDNLWARPLFKRFYTVHCLEDILDLVLEKSRKLFVEKYTLSKVSDFYSPMNS